MFSEIYKSGLVITQLEISMMNSKTFISSVISTFNLLVVACFKDLNNTKNTGCCFYNCSDPLIKIATSNVGTIKKI